tara:strand:- start:823 stop:978 length:156 start_codon:yes stop_codon:yes gene_type:complete
MAKKIIKMPKKNFTSTGFTNTGLINFAKLRRKGVGREKAIGILIKSDRRKK